MSVSIPSGKSIPDWVSAEEKRAFAGLFRRGADGVITSAEAKSFEKRFGSLFEDKKDDHRFLRYALKELVQPGTTYAYGWTPNAKLDCGASETFDKLNNNWW